LFRKGRVGDKADEKSARSVFPFAVYQARGKETDPHTVLPEEAGETKIYRG